MSVLQRIAERVESFYIDLASQSLYHPEQEANPARARWRFIQRRIKDSSFFLLTRDIHSSVDTYMGLDMERPMKASNTFDAPIGGRKKRQSVSFDQVLSQAVSSVAKSPGMTARRGPSRAPTVYEDEEAEYNLPTPRQPHQQHPQQPPGPRPLRLADAHTARAKGGRNAETSFEEQISTRAMNRMSIFMQGKMKDMRRLSKSLNQNGVFTFDHAMTLYGNGGSAPASRSQSRNRNRNGADSQPQSENEHEMDYAYTSSGSSSPTDVSPFPSRTHSRAASRQLSLDKLNGVPPRSNAGSVSSISRKDMQAATFGRKLSVYGGSRSGGSRSGDSPSRKEKAPPLPPSKASHW